MLFPLRSEAVRDEPLFHSSLDSRPIKKKKKVGGGGRTTEGHVVHAVFSATMEKTCFAFDTDSGLGFQVI